MSHSLPYSIAYITGPAMQYVLPSHTHHTHAHIPSSMHLVEPAQIRSEQTQRKRPKYTRSKTGCLTCRAKKIKCDEGKPNCRRCEHAHRECTWPDPAPPKKKIPARKSTAPQEDNAAAVGSASRASGSPVSRDATPSTRDIENSVNSTSVGSDSQTDLTRRYSGSQNYAYLEPGASMNRRQTETAYCSQTDPVSSAPINTGTNLSSYSYDFHHSPNGSISSRSNSRPSTANSLPPPTHFGNAAHHSTIDSRDYRWDTLPTHRPEATYAYYPTA